MRNSGVLYHRMLSHTLSPSIISNLILYYLLPSHTTPSHPIPSYSVPSYLILSYPIISYLFLSITISTNIIPSLPFVYFPSLPFHSPHLPVRIRSPSSLPAMQVTIPWCPELPSKTCLHLPVLGAHSLQIKAQIDEEIQKQMWKDVWEFHSQA